MFSHLRTSVRRLKQTPAFTLLVLATLGLGIGVNTAVFSIANGVLWRPLDFKDPATLVSVQFRAPQIIAGSLPMSAADVKDLAGWTKTLENVAGFESRMMEISGVGEPRRVGALRASAALFDLLGRAPLRGRAYSEDETARGEAVVLLSEPLAIGLFGSAEAAVGRDIALDRRSHRVIGVMPASFRFPLRGMAFTDEAALWVPLRYTADELAARGDNFNISVVARLRDGVSLAQADSDTRAVFRRIREQYPAAIQKLSEIFPDIQPLDAHVSRRYRESLLLLLGAVGLLLLIACANTANLLLARASRREGEMAVRSAMGASSSQLVRELIAEHLLIGVLGGSAGFVLAWLSLDWLKAIAAQALPRAEETTLDTQVLLFTTALSLLAGLAFGLVPAWWVRRRDLARSLAESGRTDAGSRARHRLRNGLVVAEVALSVILVAGAGLLLRSLSQLSSVNPGFLQENNLVLSVSLPEARYPDAASQRRLFLALRSALGELPGARAVGLSTNPPFHGNWTKAFSIEGKTRPGDPPLITSHSVVDANFFETMGIQLTRGRWFNSSDRATTTPVIVVSQRLAREVFGDRDPIGLRIKNGVPEDSQPWMTIVGVAADVRDASLEKSAQPQTYDCWEQISEQGGAWAARGMHFVIRHTGDSAAFADRVRAAVRQADPALAAEIGSVRTRVRETLRGREFQLGLFGGFAMLALLLAAVGVAGVVFLNVTQRTREIGLRMALGAGQGAILSHVLGGGLRLIAIGVLLGMAGALSLVRVLSTFLYNVAPWDPAALGGSAAALLAAGVLAAWFPALRASRVDPMDALRHD